MATEHPAIQELAETLHHDSRVICPECSQERRKKYERTLSITIEPNEILYCCHHCGASGRIERRPFYDTYVQELAKPAEKAKVAQIPTELNDSATKIKAYFEARGVDLTLGDTTPPMCTGVRWYRKLNAEVESIGFVYGEKDAPEAIKWRPLDGTKAFTQSGSAQHFYNIAALPEDPEELIIVEGEADVVALSTIGVVAVSVPNGAPMDFSQKGISERDQKYSYLWEARDLLESVERVVLCVDGDKQGDALAEEIARRIGRAKCWKVEYPEGAKDATDVLRDHTAADMLSAIEHAKPMPLEGVYVADDYIHDFNTLYEKGHGRGLSTGMAAVDDIFTIPDTGLGVITGYPGSGKSEFLDQILINLSLEHGRRHAVCSFENPPPDHMAKLAEKIVGKPFYEGVTPRMSRLERDDAQAFINDHFVFIDDKHGNVATVESIINRAKQAVLRLGVKTLVIDPYNFIERGADKQEHHGISDMLSTIISFAKAHGLFVFFVAHPKGVVPDRKGDFPIPTGHHISGGPTWWAKADIGITVHRGPQGVEIHTWKVRAKWIGKVGLAFVDYDVPTGRYRDYPNGQPGAPMSKMTGVRRDYMEMDDEGVPF